MSEQREEPAVDEAELPFRLGAAAAATLMLAACGGGGGGGSNEPLPGTGGETPTTPAVPPSRRDAARFLSQASFGPRSIEEVESLRAMGYERWLHEQFNAPTASHVAYLEEQRTRDEHGKVRDEMSYEAVWQQWLFGTDVLRARVAWAWLQIFVISNVAPDLRPHAMSSYLDMLNRHAFGNYRTLLEDATLHPAMGYYLNMLGSAKEDPKKGTHPNENYAREVLQLFSIGLAKLNPDGSTQLDADGKAIPTYDERVVKGFAKAFSGFSHGGLDTANPKVFYSHDDNVEALWVTPMQAWAAYHDDGEKILLDGRMLPPAQGPQRDLKDALDSIFNHPNVGPFIGRQLIQRLVTSNPSPAYIQRIAAVFANNGQGIRGDLRAVVRAILLDAEARGDDAATRPRFGKQREPVLRFAMFLRALGAKSANGRNSIHYLDGADDALGQSPLLAPSVFNFYSPNFRPAGPLAAGGMVAPEFQITSETTVVGSLNFFAAFFRRGGYGSGDSKLMLDFAPLVPLADGTGAALIERLDLLFFDLQMSASTRSRLSTLIAALPGTNADKRLQRVKAALTVVALSPDHVIQK
ncbi:DUF1800 domain-containing protein [Aquincola sp. S2]|uniref:DUF1800 domain-containing protein n=1 Tax=Pseudaquabacterium terrae TaxID=2732868 RepID=A0ABX2EH24_9BURK|nr:DUF1800 domain-containing protein [Aquabacterium terrae]NRF67917.1 DUF1800 domain-containing protein [Aquabacterium terrae]